MWWYERLGELRQEQGQHQEQPVLQLPVPESPPEQPEDDEPQEGTAVIDFTF